MKYHPCSSRNAFTLIELVVAVVLGTLLLTTLMGVLRRSLAELGVAMSDHPLTLRSEWLIEQLRRDLLNARQMRVGINRFELVGFIHRDPQTLIATQRPARALYEIRQSGDMAVLVRVQTDTALAMSSASGVLTEAIFIGAESLQVSSNQIGALTEADTLGLDGSATANLVGQLRSVPATVQLVLRDRRGNVIINHTFTRQRDN